jgi:hypothetical protein
MQVSTVRERVTHSAGAARCTVLRDMLCLPCMLSPVHGAEMPIFPSPTRSLSPPPPLRRSADMTNSAPSYLYFETEFCRITLRRITLYSGQNLYMAITTVHLTRPMSLR